MLTLQAPGSDDADEQQEPQDRGEDQAVGEDVHLRNGLIQCGVPETNLDFAVLELSKEGVDLAWVIREGIGLGDPARQAGRDVGRVPVAGDEDFGGLRCRYDLRLSFSPESLYLDKEIHHLGDFDV